MHEGLTHVQAEPRYSRRVALAVGGIQLTEWLDGYRSALLAQETGKASANALLRKLPKSLRLGGGKEATVETAEVPDASQLLIAVRRVHEIDPQKITPEMRRAIDGSNRETGQIIAMLHRDLGIAALAPEGFTVEGVAQHRKTLERLESLPDRIAVLKGMKRLREAAELEKALRDLEQELQRNIPFASVVPLLKSNAMQIVPAETDKARAEAKRADENPVSGPYLGAWLREDAALELLSAEVPRLKKGPGVIAPWGAAHWQPPAGKHLPLRVEQWNKTHRTARSSTAIITPPSTREYLLKHPLPELPDN